MSIVVVLHTLQRIWRIFEPPKKFQNFQVHEKVAVLNYPYIETAPFQTRRKIKKTFNFYPIDLIFWGLVQAPTQRMTSLDLFEASIVYEYMGEELALRVKWQSRRQT